MVTTQSPTATLFSLVERTTSSFLEFFSNIEEDDINRSPSRDSWTAAQVAEHVTLSNIGITTELLKEGRTCDRDPGSKVDQLKAVFLDFNKKLQAPDFILPTKVHYQKIQAVHALRMSVDRLNSVAQSKALDECLDHALLGEITRWELLHFVIYHTERHHHQMKNIVNRINHKG